MVSVSRGKPRTSGLGPDWLSVEPLATELPRLDKPAVARAEPQSIGWRQFAAFSLGEAALQDARGPSVSTGRAQPR